MAGLVEVDGIVCDKAGTPVRDDSDIRVLARPRFVSRAGEKLAGALSGFKVDPGGRSALDVGASTGGFVDCLLQSGAEKVIALDVGHGQLDARLRADARVVVMERVNARYLTPDDLPYEPDLLTMDISFISVQKVLGPVVECMAPAFEGLVLVKPQFEAGRPQVGKKGIVRDPAVHESVLIRVSRFLVNDAGVEVFGVCRSDVTGTHGNVEFFYHVGRGREKGLGLDRLDSLIADAVA
jgi:23S rRNA (cytidine1920-2'-O)/16S rRNA (cytidine1409-2'-O)-methyltransferase